MLWSKSKWLLFLSPCLKTDFFFPLISTVRICKALGSKTQTSLQTPCVAFISQAYPQWAPNHLSVTVGGFSQPSTCSLEVPACGSSLWWLCTSVFTCPSHWGGGLLCDITCHLSESNTSCWFFSLLLGWSGNLQALYIPDCNPGWFF